MEFLVGEDHVGTSEAAWAASDRLRDLQPLTGFRSRRLVVVAPHPDDEIFGAAGLIQVMSARHAREVRVIAVTDGEASHPESMREFGIDLRDMRRTESTVAFGRLGGAYPPVFSRLGLPDGRVGHHIEQLTAALCQVLSPGDLCVAPWWHDGHPDHDACGEAALLAARSVGAGLLGYLVWAWHWADPNGSDLPWEQCRRLDLSRRTAARKRWATGAFRSQTHVLGSDRDAAPLLPAVLLRRFWRAYEVFVCVAGGAS